LRVAFRKVRHLAGIERHDGAIYQPRMHDLRATFAVHRLTSWLRQDADVNRLIPALSSYMGQCGLGSTERYLKLTPERFRDQLMTLSPQNPKRKRWRDDPNLMRFLAQL
jgi:integrase/recombinase XerD